MRTKIAIGLLGIAAVLAWTGVAGAQTVTPGPKVQLPSGEEVWGLEGLWKVVVENYGEWEQFGTYPNMYLIKQTGNAFSAIRMQDNPPPSPGRNGSPSLFGELEKNGFKYIFMIGLIALESPGQARAKSVRMATRSRSTRGQRHGRP